MIEDMSKMGTSETLIGEKESRTIDRRDVLKMGLIGVLGVVTPLLPTKSSLAANHAVWRVSFRHGHTGESFSGVYRIGDKYLPDAFERLNYVLRDFRTGDVFPMDPRVIDIISLVQSETTRTSPLEVLSGYRSPKTNAMLRGNSKGVAKNSFHMYGQAIDIRMPGYKISEIGSIAKKLRSGGVGYYPKSSFVHVDTGDVRSW